MELTIISGLSGAGKSQAASFMEDLGYFCVDNVSPPLIREIVNQRKSETEVYGKIAVVTDIRSDLKFDQFFHILDELRKEGITYRIIFLEADDETIIKRYKETRHMHPLQRKGRTLKEAVRDERIFMTPLRDRADAVIDTSNQPIAVLRRKILEICGNPESDKEINIGIISFGYKYGLPLEADLVFDVRFLPNPFYVDKLKYKSGLDEEVNEYIFKDKDAGIFMEKLYDFILFLIPHYFAEGKTSLVIAVGCTGGRHRSVAVAHHLYEKLQTQYKNVTEAHRDIEKD